MRQTSFLRANSQQVLEYIDSYWSRIIRHNKEDKETLIGLPHAYLVPSDGDIFQEMYYWDSFFMALGVVETRFEYLIPDMTLNMAHMLKRFGLIPNASRYYFLSRSQPPIFTQMIWLAYRTLLSRKAETARQFLKEMIVLSEMEHESVWLGTRHPHHRRMECGLSRHFDINYLDMLASCESGWDHSTRCDDRWMEHLPIDLNSILYIREVDIARAWLELGDVEKAQQWRYRADQREELINKLMWDDASAFYYDYDLKNKMPNTTASLAGFFPLWAGLASSEQAEKMVATWLAKFEFDGGLVTSLQTQDGRQWAYPNGWAPLHWIVCEGLERYGFHDHANRIREKWCNLCIDVFEKTGALWEKYNVVEAGRMPEEGLYGSIPGFGWTNSVFVDFHRKLQKSREQAMEATSMAAEQASGQPIWSETATPVQAADLSTTL